MSKDQMRQTDELVSMLDATEALPGAASLRARSYELLALPEGAAMVDVGCGTGRAVAEMTERGANAAGVDVNADMIDLARRRHPFGDFRVAGAYMLPFGDGELGGYRADKVFHELGQPRRAVEEARRVLGSGGRIVLLGQDWDLIAIDSAEASLTRQIVHARADTIPNPRVARRYRALLLDTGFTDVTIEVHTAVFTDSTMLPMLTGLADAASSAGALTPEQTTAWKAEQTQRAADGRLFLVMPLFVASATRP